MKLTLKTEEKRKINGQLIAVAASILAIVVLVYLVSVSLNHILQQNEAAKLNAEAAAYGQQLTSEIAANSSVCTQNYSFNNSGSVKIACGAVVYCYYSSSCQYSGPQSANTVSFLCDAFKPNKLIAAGMCFKVPFN